MAGVNKVIIVGNLGNAPELRTMPNGTAVANISVATSEVWTDRNTNERREITEWHRIVFYGRQAEVAGEYLRKGSKIYVEGRLRTRKWTDQNGVDRYTTEIQGDVLQMLDSRGASNEGYAGGNTNYAPQAKPAYNNDSTSAPAQSSYPNQGYSNQASASNPSSQDFDNMPMDDDIPF